MIDYMDSTGNNSGSIQSSSSCGGGDEYDSSSHLVALPTENSAAFPSSVLNHQHFRHHYHHPQQEKNIIGYGADCADHVTQTSHFSIDPPLPPPPPVAATLAPVTYNGSVDGNLLPNFFDRSNNLNPNSTVWSRRTASAIRSSNAASCTAYDENYSYNPTQNQTNSSIAYSTTMDPVFSHNLHCSQPPPPVIHGASPTTTTSDNQHPTGHLPSTHQNKAPAIDNNTGSSGRNSKKRTRASRRAPTTVLTTDTTNFRAMVQEFTGVPSPPFFGPNTTSFLFPRNTNRLDLLSSGSKPPSTTQPSSSLLHHPTRPLPQTYASFPFVSSSIPPTATPAPNSSSSSAAVVVATTTTVDCRSVSGIGETGGGNDHVYDYGYKNRPPLLTRDQHPWDHNLQRDTTTTGLSFSVPVHPDGSYPVPNPRTGSLDVSVTGCTTAGLISTSSRLSIGLQQYSAGSLPALETAREEDNNRVSNRNSGAGRTNSPIHNHHHQQMQIAGNGMNTIESWLCSSSTSTG